MKSHREPYHGPHQGLRLSKAPLVQSRNAGPKGVVFHPTAARAQKPAWPDLSKGGTLSFPNRHLGELITFSNADCLGIWMFMAGCPTETKQPGSLQSAARPARSLATHPCPQELLGLQKTQRVQARSLPVSTPHSHIATRMPVHSVVSQHWVECPAPL